MPAPTLLVGLGGTGQLVLERVLANLRATYGGVPDEVKIRSIDTIIETRATASPELMKRYLHIGGNAWNYALATRSGTNPCVAEWFDADYFTRHTAGRNLLNLVFGAGAFRQLGRLAVFYDLTQTGNQAKLGALRADIIAIKNLLGGNRLPLSVVVTGSLAGGTGTGTFIDVAHTIRSYVEQLDPDWTVEMRGCFVLPRAFEGTTDADNLQPNDRIALQARCFAALREIGRFAESFQYSEGLPMPYVCDGRNDPVLNGRVKSTLFKRIYLFDGVRPQNSLDRVRVAEGVAPTIAELISAMVDDTAVRVLAAHDANVAAAINNNNLDGKVVVGSFGSYTLLYPIDHIIDGWSHALATQVLRTLLPPSGAMPEGIYNLPGLADDHAGGQQGQSGEEGAGVYWQELPYLQGHLGRSGLEYTKGAGNAELEVKRVSGLSLDALVGQLDPGPGQGQEVEQTQARVASLKQAFLSPESRPRPGAGGTFGLGGPRDYAEVRPRHTTAAKTDADNIVGECERLKRTHLGLNDTSRRYRLDERQGGQWGQALRELARWQEARFRDNLQGELYRILNGDAQDDDDHAVENRAGKLGFAHSFVAAMARHLDGARQCLVRARLDHRSEWQNLRNERQAASGEMGKNHGTQRRYLAIEQRMLELDHWDIAARVQEESAERMQAIAQEYLTSLDAWVNWLATEPGGLWAELGRSTAQAANQRRGAGAFRRVVEPVNDQAYEGTRYVAYTHRVVPYGETMNFLRAFSWQVGQREVHDENALGSRVESYVGLQLGTERDAAGNPTDFVDLAVGDGSGAENRDRVLDRSRLVFARARQEESISRYLMSRYPPGQEPQLAQLLLGRNGPLLQWACAYSGRYPRLSVHDDPALAGQAQYLNLLQVAVADQLNLPANQAFQLVNSQDRFRFSFFQLAECLDIDGVLEYDQARTLYLGLPERIRKLHHVLPAETNAVAREEKSRLNNALNLFPNRQVSQLEDSKRFDLAVLCLAYEHGRSGGSPGLINRHTYTDALGQDHTVWRLTLPVDPATQQGGFGYDESADDLGEQPGAAESMTADSAFVFGDDQQEAGFADEGTGLGQGADDLAGGYQPDDQPQPDTADLQGEYAGGGYGAGALPTEEHYFLTDPDDEPDLAAALTTFCLDGKTKWKAEGDGLPVTAREGFAYKIEHERIAPVLEQWKEQDCLDRLAGGRLGVRILPWLRAVLPRGWQTGQPIHAVQKRVAELERLFEYKVFADRQWKPGINQRAGVPGAGPAAGDLTAEQEQYRLLAAHLTLKTEQTVRELAKQHHLTPPPPGPRPGANPPPPRPPAGPPASLPPYRPGGQPPRPSARA